MSSASLWQRVSFVLIISVWVFVYYTTSAASAAWNKQLVDTHSAGGGRVSVTVLTLLHLLVSLASDALFMRFSKEGVPRFPPDHGRHSSWDIIIGFAPISVFVVLSKLFTYVSYQTVSVALSHTAKASEPIFNVIIAAVAFREYHSHAVYVSLIPIAAGVMLASITDFTYNHVGFVFAVVSALMKVLQNIYTKRLMNTGKFTFWEIHLYCGAASLLMLLPVMIMEISMAVDNPFAHFPFFQLFECSVLQYASSVSSYMVLNLVSHLTFTIVNVMKRLFIIISGTMFDGLDLQPLNVFGVTIAVVGILMYNIVKDVPPGTPGPQNPWSMWSWTKWVARVAMRTQPGASPDDAAGDGVSSATRKRTDIESKDSTSNGVSPSSSDAALSIRVDGSDRSDGEPELTRRPVASASLLHAPWESPIAGTPMKYARVAADAAAAADGVARALLMSVPTTGPPLVSPPKSNGRAVQGGADGFRAGAMSARDTLHEGSPRSLQRAYGASSGVLPASPAVRSIASPHAPVGVAASVAGDRPGEVHLGATLLPASSASATTVASFSSGSMPTTSPNWGHSVFGPHAGTIGIVQRSAVRMK